MKFLYKILCYFNCHMLMTMKEIEPKTYLLKCKYCNKEYLKRIDVNLLYPMSREIDDYQLKCIKKKG